MLTGYQDSRADTYGATGPSRMKGWKNVVKQIYKDSLDLTKEERERLLEGFMRLTVTKEVPPFFGRERQIYERLEELRDTLWAAREAEQNINAPKPQILSSAAFFEEDADNHIYNINNNINTNINPKRKETINISMNDHDNDNRERKMFLEETDRELYGHSYGKGSDENTQEDPVAQVVAGVEALCNFECFDYVRNQIAHYVGLLGEEVCLLAIERASKFRGKSWGYIQRILDTWYNAGVRTPEQAAAFNKSFDNRRKNYNPPNTTPSDTYGNQKNNCSMYQTHTSKPSPLERKAIDSAIEEFGDSEIE